MIQEYLFSDSSQRESFAAYKPLKANVGIQDLDGSDCWIATFTIDGNNETNALLLSEIHENIENSFHCITLTNESSAYFNKALFPLINEFERKLRKYLYLVSERSDGGDGKENIKELESMDLGTLFTLIFTDPDFVLLTKKAINDKSWKFTKVEVLQSISAIEENTLWDKMMGIETVPTLRERFILLKDYRNDVMHAHDINAAIYRNTKQLYIKVNSELDKAINIEITTSDISLDNGKKNGESNTSLTDAIAQTKLATFMTGIEQLQKALQPVNFQQSELQEAYKATLSPLARELRQMQEALKGVEPSPLARELRQMQEALKGVEPSPYARELRKMQEALKGVEPSPLARELRQMQEALKGVEQPLIFSQSKQTKEENCDIKTTKEIERTEELEGSEEDGQDEI